jgi:hypothetical protein
VQYYSTVIAPAAFSNSPFIHGSPSQSRPKPDFIAKFRTFNVAATSTRWLPSLGATRGVDFRPLIGGKEVVGSDLTGVFAVTKPAGEPVFASPPLNRAPEVAQRFRKSDALKISPDHCFEFSG